ncbi:MAG: substrate-binding domain-containing protein [Gemmatimonadota bacterium]
MRRLSYLPALLLLIAGCGGPPGKTRLVLATTTSLEDTGLLELLAVEFRKAHPEIELAPVAVGTGQAIALGRGHDADVLVTHDSAAEVQLVRDGIAKERRSVMYNDFVIAGPAQDAERIRGMNALAALRALAAGDTPFISRGDDSGTHRKELALWREAGLTPRGTWYVEAGLGQGDALVLAGQKRAYVLTDRATFLRMRPRINLEILVANDPPLLNSYGVTVLHGAREAAARVFADWITSEEVQRLIGTFGQAELGQSLFVPSAHGAVLHDTIPTGER